MPIYVRVSGERLFARRCTGGAGAGGGGSREAGGEKVVGVCARDEANQNQRRPQGGSGGG